MKIYTYLQEICSIWAQNCFFYCFWTILGAQLKNNNNFRYILEILPSSTDVSNVRNVRKLPCTPPPIFDLQQWIVHRFVHCLLHSRCLMVSTIQADPSCFYFRISRILMEQHWFYLFCPLHLVQGLRSLKHWLLQKLSMKIFDQKFRFLIKK